MSPFALPSAPKPAKLRLLARNASAASRLKPPCGVASWSLAHDEGADLAILLERPGGHEVPTLDEIAAQIPAPGTLRAGMLVLVLGEVEPSGALLGRWIGGRTVVPRRLRTSALLALGYERLGGAVDPKSAHDLAWGYVPAP